MLRKVDRRSVRRGVVGASSRSTVTTLGLTALVPTGVTVALLLALTLVGLLVGHHDFSQTPHVVSAMWLAINQVPLASDGVTLSMLPLVPTLLYGFAVAWQARTTSLPFAAEAAATAEEARPGLPTEQMQAAERQAILTTVAMVVVPLVVSGLAATVLDTASADFPARVESLGGAVLWTIVVNLVAVGIGLWWAHVRWLRRRVPSYVVAGIHMGGAFVAATWAIAGLALLVTLLSDWSDLGMLFDTASGDAWGTFALLLLSIGYAPNLFALGSAAVSGGQAHIGDASASVFSVNPGDLPSLPLLAAWPSAHPQWWWQVFLVLTALSAVLVARLAARWFAKTRDGLLACVAAAVTAVVVMMAGCVLAGGQVGLLGNAGYPLGLAALFAAVWMGVLGAATMALSLVGVARRRTASAQRIEQRRERLAARSSRPGTSTYDGGVPSRPAADDVWDTAENQRIDGGDEGTGESMVAEVVPMGAAAATAAAAEDTAGETDAIEPDAGDAGAVAADGDGDDVADGGDDAEAPAAAEPGGREDTEGETPAETRGVDAEVARSADDPDTDEIPLITEEMLAEAEAADGWGEDGAPEGVDRRGEAEARDASSDRESTHSERP